ncbi:MAG: hypothetical protein NTW96_26580, partial [Planctomycetia bacterium]|nr:hypothetical protein [Planctomycetia bacterium]
SSSSTATKRNLWRIRASTFASCIRGSSHLPPHLPIPICKGYFFALPNAAYKEVQRRIAIAKQREKRALASQLAAARLRLMRELGRFLVCVAGTSADLNRVFHEQMTRDIAGAKRLQRSYQLLGGYPEWPDQMKEELDLYYAGLSKNQRSGRLMGSELDAALQDPRWGAVALRSLLRWVNPSEIYAG